MESICAFYRVCHAPAGREPRRTAESGSSPVIPIPPMEKRILKHERRHLNASRHPTKLSAFFASELFAAGVIQNSAMKTLGALAERCKLGLNSRIVGLY